MRHAWVIAVCCLSCDDAPVTRANEQRAAQTASRSAPDKPRTRKGNSDVTFLVTADTHFGFSDIATSHVKAIKAMRSVEGMKFPANVPTVAGKPRGLLIAGDLTEDGRPEEWQAFVDHYDAMLDYPVFESWGNHDKHYGWYVRQKVIDRHGGVRYSWDWDDLHIVCLGEAPDHDDIAWLEKDLAGAGKEVGVILYMHFPLRGPFSRRNWFGDGDYKRPLMLALMDYNVVGIFHGHFHATGMYTYQNHDVYNVGTPKHGFPSFSIVRVTDKRMTVASYNYELEKFWWWHDKPINGADGPTRRYIQPGLIGGARASSDTR